MIVASALQTVMYIAGLWLYAELAESRFVKRIIDGDASWLHDEYDTDYFVHLRESFACTSNQDRHEVGFLDCQEDAFCGGTLFTPEFVITAAHCVSYKEFYLRDTSHIQLGNVDDDLILRARGGERFFGLFDQDVRVSAITIKKKHIFYSNVALFAGSTDYFEMTQKRHAQKIFPHPDFDGGGSSVLVKDVALIQVCEPFEITATVKPVPMLPLNQLPAQYESVVKRSAACLYMGFGETNDPFTNVEITENYTIPTPFLRYTWRLSACSTKCNFEHDTGWTYDHPRNPCFLCSYHISPRLGAPSHGDSGSPVMCDGYYMGPLSSGGSNEAINFTDTNVFALHCIKDAITPERLAYYKSVPEEDKVKHPLGPVQRRFLLN